MFYDSKVSNARYCLRPHAQGNVVLGSLPGSGGDDSCMYKNICAGNKVFLDGDLERGIVPEDSVWMHGGGNGEDGCLLLLRKMNLELLRRWGPYPVGAPCAFSKRGV